MLRLLRRNFLVFYPSKPSTCLTLHPNPIIPSTYTACRQRTTSMLFRASRSGQYTGILVLQQLLKIEQTFSHGNQPLAFWSSNTSILIDCKPTFPVLHIIITLFIDSTVYLYRASPHLFSLSRSFDYHRLGCLINFLDVVLFFLSAPLSPQLLCPRTYFALSKVLLPDHIVARRL